MRPHTIQSRLPKPSQKFHLFLCLGVLSAKWTSNSLFRILCYVQLSVPTAKCFRHLFPQTRQLILPALFLVIFPLELSSVSFCCWPSFITSLWCNCFLYLLLTFDLKILLSSLQPPLRLSHFGACLCHCVQFP